MITYTSFSKVKEHYWLQNINNSNYIKEHVCTINNTNLVLYLFLNSYMLLTRNREISIPIFKCLFQAQHEKFCWVIILKLQKKCLNFVWKLKNIFKLWKQINIAAYETSAILQIWNITPTAPIFESHLPPTTKLHLLLKRLKLGLIKK